MNKIAQLTAAARAEILAETANRRGLPEALVEKDFWVCWMLAQIFSIEQLKSGLLFKGGTSLSKVFGVIERFSEDIDLAVDYTMLGFTGARDPLATNLSRTKQQALLGEMLAACQRYIAGEFLGRLRSRCTEVLGPEGSWRLAIDEQDPNIVDFSILPLSRSRSAMLRRELRSNWEPMPSSSRAGNSRFALSPPLSFQSSSSRPKCP